jgi:hypothetical protein
MKCLDQEGKRSVATDASVPQPCPGRADSAQSGVAEEDDLFAEALIHASALISWSRSDEVRGLTHDAREELFCREAWKFARLCLQGRDTRIGIRRRASRLRYTAYERAGADECATSVVWRSPE